MEIPSASEPFKYGYHEDVYMCLQCGTHITLHRQLLRKYAENGKHYALFEDLLNIEGDPDKMITNKKSTARSVYCVKCHADLGFKFIALEEQADDVEEGRFLVFTNKLLLWKGNQILDPETEQPIQKVKKEMI